jgi:hypothetical protein
MFPGVRIPEYFVKLYNLIVLDKLQYQKETFGSKHVSAFILNEMSFYRVDIDHSWPLSFVFINNQLTFMLYYSNISNKTENSVLGDDAIYI